MSDLISRKYAIYELRDLIIEPDISDDEIKIEGYNEGLEAAISLLSVLSSAELKQKKGKWQRRKGEDCWECSECHAVLENDDIANHNFYYCYHCGVDMMDKDGYMDLEKAEYDK